MKRKFFWIFLAMSFVVVALVIRSLRNRDLYIPYFVAGTPASLPQIGRVDYDWLTDAPFQNDQLWCWTVTAPRVPGKRVHAYLYDLKKRAIQGELFNGTYAGVRNSDGSRILARNSELKLSFREQMYVMFAKMFGRKVTPSGYRLETYWVLDLPGKVATKIGEFSQISGGGSIWHPSPDLRRAYNVPTLSKRTTLYICDFDSLWMGRFEVDGYPRGWWDDHQILLERGSEQFDLYDTQTGKTTTLVTRDDVQFLLARAGIKSSEDVGANPSWNGTNYDFYLDLGHLVVRTKSNAPSFRIKVNRSGPLLSLVSTNFLFHWGASFHASGDLYLIQGESGAPGRGGDGSVYVRNLTNGTETMIVPPDKKGQYSIPKFYGDEVIYFRDRTLHRVALDGSNDSLVFPNVAK